MFYRSIKFIFVKKTIEFAKEDTNKVIDEINSLLSRICCWIGKSKYKFLSSICWQWLMKKYAKLRQKLFPHISHTVFHLWCYSYNNERCIKLFWQQPRTFWLWFINTLCVDLLFWMFLHICYKLGLKKLQAKSTENKASVKQLSEKSEQWLRYEMGLTVDKPKPGLD